MDDRKPLFSLEARASSETVLKQKGAFDKPLKSLKLFLLFFRETAFFVLNILLTKSVTYVGESNVTYVTDRTVAVVN